MPLERSWIACIHRQRRWTELLIDGLHLKSNTFEDRPNQIPNFPSLVFNPRHDLDHDRAAVETPRPIVERRPGRFHGRGNLLDRQIGVITNICRAHHREDRQLIVIELTDVGYHGQRSPLVDVTRDERPVYQQLHCRPHFFQREGIQASFWSGSRIQNQ